MQSIIDIIQRTEPSQLLQGVAILHKNEAVIEVCANEISSEGRSTVLLDAIGALLDVGDVSLLTVLLSHQARALKCDAVGLYFVQLCVKCLPRFYSSECFQLVAAEAVAVVRTLTHFCVAQKICRRIIRPLMHLSTLMPQHVLTPVHACCLQACVWGGMLELGADFAKSVNIFEVNTKDSMTHINIDDYLNYFYNAGWCCMEMSDYGAASSFFVDVISTPAEAVHALVMDSLKKLYLISLLSDGKKFILPGCVPQAVFKYAANWTCPVYDQLVQFFMAKDFTGLSEALSQKDTADVLAQDGNLCLAHKLLPSLQRLKLKALSKMYITLPLHDILSHVSPHIIPSAPIDSAAASTTPAVMLPTKELVKEYEKLHILNEIGDTRLQLDSVTNLVSFTDSVSLPNEEHLKTPKLIDFFQQSIRETMTLSYVIRQKTVEVMCSDEYSKGLVGSSFGGRRYRDRERDEDDYEVAAMLHG